MNILLIAPLPPPTNGMSLASKVLLDGIPQFHRIKIINLSKKKRPNSIGDHFKRSIEVLEFFWRVILRRRNVDLVYFTISESIAGNIKDLIIYLLCVGKLDKIYIHMLGGAGMKSILQNQQLLRHLNKFFISRVRGVIVEGNAQRATFETLTSQERIHIVPNFAEDFLFIDELIVKNKFDDVLPIKILYLSNLIFGKGYEELADAYLSLSSEMKDKIELTFVGGFQSVTHEMAFLNKIKNEKGIIYYGKFVAGKEKKALYLKSHVFCLPTYYPYEGQPISILEAYATGCVVVATLHSGIPDVFCNGKNGYAVEKKSVDSIREVLQRLIIEKNTDLLQFALNNAKQAKEKYRTSIYTKSMLSILELNGQKNESDS